MKVIEDSYEGYRIMFSNYDGGYYAERPNNKYDVSQVFDTLEKLKTAIDNNTLIWET